MLGNAPGGWQLRWAPHSFQEAAAARLAAERAGRLAGWSPPLAWMLGLCLQPQACALGRLESALQAHVSVSSLRIIMQLSSVITDTMFSHGCSQKLHLFCCRPSS